MCKVKQLVSINDQIKALEEAKKALCAEIYASMIVNGTDKMVSEDGTQYVKWVKVADKEMPAKPAYIKKGYDYLRVY